VSLRIDINTIARLLLEDGVWYEVLPGSLMVDSYEWTDSKGLVVDGGNSVGVPAIAVRFKARGMNGWISCPLQSILAVHYEPIEIDEPIAISIPKGIADEIDTHL
jgi:hypothetical protein